MTTKSIVIGIVSVLAMAIAVEKVAAFETQRHSTFNTPYNGTISGTVTSTQIDAVNPGDGVKGFLATFAVTTRHLGQVTVQALVEDAPVSVPSGTCAAGTDAEFTLGSLHGVHRFPNGDLLYLNALMRKVCVDFETFTVNVDEAGEFDGGTGRFSQATGSWKITGSSKISVIDGSGQLFGPFSGKLKGTIVTPTRIRVGK